MVKKFLPFCFGFLSFGAQASGGEGGALDAYTLIADFLGVSHDLVPSFSALLSVPLLILFGLIYRQGAQGVLKSGELRPKRKVSVFGLFDMVLDFLYGMTKDTCGTGFLSFFPLLSALFLFVLLNNLSGLVPGFSPSTGNFSMNLSLGLAVFLAYNWAGVREHGFAYAKQFMGPFLLMAPLFICLEVISHLSRPLSLAFRLTANIFGDHLLLSVFSGLVPLLVPVFLMFFGLLVACVQSFVFTLLTGIYISMAVSHDH